MTITITIPDTNVPAWQRRLAAYNAGSGAAPITLPQLVQILHDEETQKLEQVHQAALRDLMRGVADQIIVAAGGDTTKLQAAIEAAIEAGKQAALEAIA